MKPRDFIFWLQGVLSSTFIDTAIPEMDMLIKLITEKMKEVEWSEPVNPIIPAYPDSPTIPKPYWPGIVTMYGCRTADYKPLPPTETSSASSYTDKKD